MSGVLLLGDDTNERLFRKQRAEDGVPDLTKIPDIDNSGISLNLQTRFARDEIYTCCGTILVACNPFKRLKCFEPDDVRRYMGKRFGSEPPHIFATAEAAFDSLRSKEGNQSVVISGESGSGKTESTKLILQYLTAVTSNQVWIEQQIMEANTVLEALGNARTLRNNNSSRFGKFTQVCFSVDDTINGCIIEDYLLEKSRISFQAEGERNYHVFYQLTACCRASPEDKVRYMMESPKWYRYLNQSTCIAIEGVDDVKLFDDLRRAMTVLDMPSDMQHHVFSAISSVLLLGNLEFDDVDGESVDLTSGDLAILQKVCTLMKTEMAALKKALTYRQLVVRGNASDIPLKLMDARANRDSSAQAIYERVFKLLIRHINSKTNPGVQRSAFIGVLDIFGFENFKVNSFEQMCINYTNEKLHRFFNHFCFALEQAEYQREGIVCEHFQWLDNQPCLDLIDKPKQCVLSFLDESCVLKTSVDQDFVAKIHKALPDISPQYYVVPDKTKVKTHFGINHYAGVVLYSCDGFLAKNRNTHMTLLNEALHSSPLSLISALGETPPEPTATDSKTATATGLMSHSALFKEQLSKLHATLSVTTPWYVRCIKTNSKQRPNLWESETVLEQLQYTGMLDVIQIRAKGFPFKIPYRMFLDKYRCLAPRSLFGSGATPPETARAIMERFDHFRTSDWQIGYEKIFFRQNCYDPLEDMRRQVIHDAATAIQSMWRMYVQRCKYLHIRRMALFVQFKTRRFLRLKYEYRMGLARKFLTAWIRGFLARKMYLAMKAEHLRKKLTKEQRAANKKAKEKLAMAAAEAKLEVERAEGVLIGAKIAVKEKEKEREKLAQRAAKGDDVADALKSLDTLLAELRETAAEAETDFNDIKKLYEAAKQNFSKFSEQNQTLGPATKGKFKPGQAVDNTTFFFMEDGQLKQQQRNKEVVEGDPTLMQYAEKALRGNFRRRQHESVMSHEDMMCFSKEKAILQSLTIIPFSAIEELRLAMQCWERLQAYLNGSYRKPAALNEFFVWMLSQGRAYPLLRDELYIQLLRQLRLVYDKSNKTTLYRGWMLMRFYVTTFPPSHALHKHLNAFLFVMEQQAAGGKLGGLPSVGSGTGSATTGFRRMTNSGAGAGPPEDAEQFKQPETILRVSPEWCRAALKHTKLNGVRKYNPSIEEIQHVQATDDMDVIVFFLDGDIEHVKVSPSLTAQELVEEISSVKKLEDSQGWSLFSIYDDHEDQIRGMEYVGDVFGMWEMEQKNVVANIRKEFPDIRVLSTAQYQALYSEDVDGKKVTAAKQGKGAANSIKFRKSKLQLGFERRRDPTEIASEVRPPLLVFKKRLFVKDKMKPKGPVDQALLYAQAVHSVLTYQLPLAVKEALALGGFQARIELDAFSNFGLSSLSEVGEDRYGRLERFLSDRVLENFQRENKRERSDWLQLLAKKHRDVPESIDKDQCRAEYLKIAMSSPLFGSTLFPASYVGYWCFPQGIEIDVHEHGIRFIHRSTKEELRTYLWARLENLSLNLALDQAVAVGKIEKLSEFVDRITFTLNRLSVDEDPLKREQLEYVFESPRARDIAQLISSYSPDKKHQQWMKSRDEEARMRRNLISEGERVALERRSWVLRCQLYDLGLLPLRPRNVLPSQSEAPADAKRSNKKDKCTNAPRLSAIDLNINVDDALVASLRESYADSFWEFTRDTSDKIAPITGLVVPGALAAAPSPVHGALSKEDLVKHAQRLLASIRIYAGIDTVGGYFLSTDKNLVPMVQACISRCIESPVLCDEFFLQLVRMTTAGPRVKTTAAEQLQIWKLFCIVCGVIAPHHDTIFDYVTGHFQSVGASAVSLEAKHAQYCLHTLYHTRTKRSRTFPPSAVEQLCAANLSAIQTRVFFLDKQFQTYMHGPCTTMAELRQSVKAKIGLSLEIDFYTLFEVFGPKMEREMQPKENVCDILFKWEKFGESSKSPEALQLTFKRGPLMGDFVRPSTRIEFYLALHQAIFDVMNGLFPITQKEAVYLAALRAQHDMGSFSRLNLGHGKYKWIVDNFIPESLRDDPEIADDIAEQHERLKGISDYDCDRSYLDTVLRWPCYGSMLYEVEQTYTSAVARNLWFAVNADGVSLIARGEKEPLMSYTYEDIVSFSPSLRCLMVVVSSLSQGIKYVFQTSQASQIANLMTRYCELAKASGAAKKLPINVGGSVQQENILTVSNERNNSFWRVQTKRLSVNEHGTSMRESKEEAARRRKEEVERFKKSNVTFESMIMGAEVDVDDDYDGSAAAALPSPKPKGGHVSFMEVHDAPAARAGQGRKKSSASVFPAPGPGSEPELESAVGVAVNTIAETGFEEPSDMLAQDDDQYVAAAANKRGTSGYIPMGESEEQFSADEAPVLDGDTAFPQYIDEEVFAETVFTDILNEQQQQQRPPPGPVYLSVEASTPRTSVAELTPGVLIEDDAGPVVSNVRFVEETMSDERVVLATW